MTLERAFLESKEFECNNGWSDYPCKVKSSSGNVKQIHEDVVSFTEYNFLPVGGSELDGHYTFFVNYKTFKYFVYKSSDYGSLTYTLPSKNTNWCLLNDLDVKIVEAVIADKLLRTCFYEYGAMNGYGKMLIPFNTSQDNEYHGIGAARIFNYSESPVLEKKDNDAIKLLVCKVE